MFVLVMARLYCNNQDFQLFLCHTRVHTLRLAKQKEVRLQLESGVKLTLMQPNAGIKRLGIE